MYLLQVLCTCKPHRASKGTEACAETLVVKEQPSFHVAFLREENRREMRAMIASESGLFSVCNSTNVIPDLSEQRTVASGSSIRDQRP
jgi:hypothetical protein